MSDLSHTPDRDIHVFLLRTTAKQLAKETGLARLALGLAHGGRLWGLLLLGLLHRNQRLGRRAASSHNR